MQLSIRSLRIEESARVLHEDLLMAVLMYDRKKELSKMRAVHMDNIYGLLDVGNIDIIVNPLFRELSVMKKRVDGRIEENFLM